MRPLIDRWSVFKTALGTRSYGLSDLAKLAAALAAAAYFYWYGREMSSVEIALAVMSVVFIFLFWIMLEHALMLTRQISDARVRLAELRVEGVEIRNAGLEGVTDKAELESWGRRIGAWTDDVQSELGKISKSDAVWFSVLDIVPSPRISPSRWPKGNPEHGEFLKLFAQHDFRVMRLGEMIRELWSK
jgi:hypothetical protein